MICRDLQHPTLTSYLLSAVETMETVAPACRIGVFLLARYDRLAIAFPHDPFSVNEGTPSFFAETLAFLTNGIPETRPGVEPEDAKHDLYWRRYRDWMRANA